MDSETKLAEARKAAVKVYFEKIDAGNTDDAYFGLFTDDVVLYFPKFGFVQGKDGIKKLGEQLGAFLKSLHHDIDNFIYITGPLFHSWRASFSDPFKQFDPFAVTGCEIRVDVNMHSLYEIPFKFKNIAKQTI